MEKMMDLLLNAENVRIMVLMVFGYCGYVRLKTSFEKKLGVLDRKIDNVEVSLNKKIDGVELSLNKKIDGVESALNKKIDGVESALNKKIDDRLNALETSLLKAMDEKIDSKLAIFYARLKTNDFAHLNNTIEALTFMLEKNKFLEKEDKEFIDRRLDR